MRGPGYHVLTYKTPAGPRAGILVGETVWDAATITETQRYESVLGILEDWVTAKRSIDESVSRIHPFGGASLDTIELLPPILYPGQVFAAGANYQDHISEMGKSEFQAQNAKTIGGRPWHFSKSSRSAMIGHEAVFPLPSYSQKVDWEIELAVVIGRTAKNVVADKALDYVAGYTIANDLSARDHVVRDGIEPNSPFRFDWISHKGFDGACPIGPWITPATAIPDPQSLGLKLWIDGNLMQDSNTKYMIFSVAEQIEELSARLTLHPGDVILTGTPAGVGMTRNVFLRPGQRLRLWIEGIGELHHGFT